MPKGSCDNLLDPTGFNNVTMSKGNGDVTVDVRWTWDRVSVYPDCDGPLDRIHYTNTGQTTWYAHLRRPKNGTPLTVEIAPGTDDIVRAQALSRVGLTTLSDMGGLGLSTDPNPPAELV